MVNNKIKIDSNISKNRKFLDDLLVSSSYSFDSKLRSTLPEKPGIYIIIDLGGEVLRAGSTKTSNSLRQRIYQNHLMGNQTGNIRHQLVANGICDNLDEAKTFLKHNCKVQWIEIIDSDDRKWAEHFMLSTLQPKFSD